MRDAGKTCKSDELVLARCLGIFGGRREGRFEC